MIFQLLLTSSSLQLTNYTVILTKHSIIYEILSKQPYKDNLNTPILTNKFIVCNELS